MMTKSTIAVALLVSLVNGASLYGGSSVSGFQGSNGFQSPGGNVSIDAKIRGFKAFLYLFAPDSWITAWNAIPIAGQECFIEEASDPANADVYNSDDTQKIKQQIQSQCSNASTEIGAFIDATTQTVNSLPATFLADSKAWATQAQSLGEELKSAVANGGANVQQQMGSGVFKQKISQFSTLTAAFTAKIALYSDADRQQIATAFPKLQPFISGDHAVEFLNEVTALYQTLGAGTLDANALKTQAAKLKPTLQVIWQQYQTQNADGLKQAGLLLGNDLTHLTSAFNAQTGGSVSPNGLQFGGQLGLGQGVPQVPNTIGQSAPQVPNTIGQSAPQVPNTIGQSAPQVPNTIGQSAPQVPNTIGQSAPQVSNVLAQGVEQGNAGTDKVKQWLQTAKQNTQQSLQEFKENASQGVQQFKDKIAALKEQHSGQPQVSGQVSVN